MPFFHRLPRWLVTAMMAEALVLLGAIGLFGARYWPMAQHQSIAAIGVPRAQPAHHEVVPVTVFTDNAFSAPADQKLKDRQLAVAKIGQAGAHEATH